MAKEGDERFLYLIRYWPDDFDRPWPMPDNMPERLEWAWSHYCRQYQQASWLEDDSVPYLDCLTGTEIFAEAFGAQVYREEGNMPYAQPLVHNASEAERLRVPSLDAPSLKRMFDMADELTRRAGPGVPVRMVDVQSPMDIAAILWDKTDLYMAVLETPEVVAELALKIRTLLTDFLDEWFRRYGREHIAHFPDYYMDGGMTLSEDEIGAVSPQVFVELFLPELNALSDRYGGIGIHCCANSRHQWDGLKKVRNLRLLNIIQPVGTVREAYRFFERDVVHWHGWNGDGDPWTWKDQHPPGARFVIDLWTRDREEALRWSKRLASRR